MRIFARILLLAASVAIVNALGHCDANATDSTTACSQPGKSGGNLLLQKTANLERFSSADEDEHMNDQASKGADCSSMYRECPQGYTVKANPLGCASSPCTQDDVQNCCDWDQYCSKNGLMDFRLSNITQNNLGNHGPDVGDNLEEGIIIANVFPDMGKDISLKISAQTPYVAHKTDRNGLWKNGEFMQINVRAETEVELKFSFLDSESLEPVVVPSFYATFYDLDQMRDGEAEESLTFNDDFTSVALHPSTSCGRRQENGREVFYSTKYGGLKDNPTHPRTLSSLQKKKAVSLLMKEGSDFTVAFAVGDVEATEDKGRNVLFSGASSMTCPAQDLCNTLTCPTGFISRDSGESPRDGMVCAGAPCNVVTDRDTCCQAETICVVSERMTLDAATISRNNLGQQGPNTADEEGIVYDNVFPNSGKSISLVLNAESEYHPHDKDNGLNKEGNIGRISLDTGTTVDIVASFIDTATSEPVEVGPFWMTFIDFDEMKDEGFGREYVTVSGHASWSLTDTTLVTVTQDAAKGTTTFRSSEFGRGKDNPADPLALSQDQKDKTAIVEYPRTSTIRFTFGASEVPPKWGNSGRNILFAGVSNLACPAVVR